MEISRVNDIIGVKQADLNRNINQDNVKTDIVKEASAKGQAGNGKKDIEDAVDIANKMLFKNNTHLKFEIHDRTNVVMVKIVNDETGEVVKEIPPQKMLDIAADLWEIAGLIVDEKR